MRSLLDFLRSTYFQPKGIALAVLLMLVGNFGIGLFKSGDTVQADIEPTFAVETVSVSNKIVTGLAVKPETKSDEKADSGKVDSFVPEAPDVGWTPSTRPEPTCNFCIYIPGVLSSPIQTVSMGPAPTYEIGVPASTVGWWNGSALPGQNGVVFLDGHSPGILGGLSSVGIGSTFTVDSNGKTYAYQVTGKAVYERSRADLMTIATQSIQGGGGKGLNIMTCAGSPVGNTYSHRLIVFAVQI